MQFNYQSRCGKLHNKPFHTTKLQLHTNVLVALDVSSTTAMVNDPQPICMESYKSAHARTPLVSGSEYMKRTTTIRSDIRMQPA